uniref:PTBP1-like RNA recognition motif 2 domain-containing protein n=1 Tax=Oryza barthii TaxID=65489 RepID=A0A0D3FTT9_9ORYZ
MASVSEPLTMASDVERVLNVTVSNLLYPVTEDILHRVFYTSSGARRSLSSIPISSDGRNIYDGCCRMDIHLELPSSVATSSNSASTAPFSQIIEELRADLKELAAMLQEKSLKDEERRNREAAAANLSVSAARTPAIFSIGRQFLEKSASSASGEGFHHTEKTTGLRLNLCKVAMIRVAERFPRLVGKREQHIPAPFSQARRAVAGEVGEN